jgi:hypothetical protein
MNISVTIVRISRALIAGIIPLGFSAAALAVCDYEPDAPDCSCFVDTGIWDPSGGFIQDIAQQTVGTIESCRCIEPPDDPLCNWDPYPADSTKNFADSGKPYYQMQLGNDEPFAAFSAAVLIANGTASYPGRGAWCSETVSYWHKHAHIPYEGGYRNDRHPDWQITNARNLVNWYAVERALEPYGGRGWFIYAHEVDYDDFELGRSVPVPGAYIAIRGYTLGTPDSWEDWAQTGHSAIIDEMWVHRDAFGTVYRIEVTIQEGNAGNQVRNSDWRPDDLATLLPQGSGWLGSRKIFGFGIDLNVDGSPIYDPSRLHYVDHPFVIQPFFPTSIVAIDQYFDQISFDKMVAYGQFLANSGGFGVTSTGLNLGGLPDGAQQQWHFPQSLTAPVEIVVDLRTAHPEPLKGIELRWTGHQPPHGYTVEYALANQQYVAALVPDLSNSQLPTEATSVAVPVMFDPNGSVAGVRYIKLLFPTEVFAEMGGTVQELRIVEDEGPEEDALENPATITHTPDCTTAYAQEACLWPPNHKFTDVAIKGITGTDGSAIAAQIFAISSDEAPASAKGSGGRKHAPDASGIGTDTASLRAERSAKGDGRVYVVHFLAEDDGRQCTGDVVVRVPRNRGSKACLAVDSGQVYDATSRD